MSSDEKLVKGKQLHLVDRGFSVKMLQHIYSVIEGWHVESWELHLIITSVNVASVFFFSLFAPTLGKRNAALAHPTITSEAVIMLTALRASTDWLNGRMLAQ